MPLYEYRCGACGHTFELLQKVSERPKIHCPLCRGKLEKLISRTSFQLKGGGWFAQGYGAGSPGSSKGTESGGGTADKGAKPKDGAKTAPPSSKGSSGGTD
jgi:putative FmdB family regulatory protein